MVRRFRYAGEVVVANNQAEQDRWVVLTVRLPEPLHDQVKDKAKGSDLTIAQATRFALRAWVAGEIGN